MSLIRELLAWARGQSPWRPIDTHPRENGARFIVGSPYSLPPLMGWDDMLEPQQMEVIVDLEFYGDPDDPVFCGAKNQFPYFPHYFTHWRPCP